MNALLSGLNPVQIGATIVAIVLILIGTVVLPMYILVMTIVDKIRIRMGLKPFDSGLTLTQMNETERSE